MANINGEDGKKGNLFVEVDSSMAEESPDITASVSSAISSIVSTGAQ
jgi:hypothetical protein